MLDVLEPWLRSADLIQQVRDIARLAATRAGDLDQHGDGSAFTIVQETRREAVVLEPRLRDPEHRFGRIDAGTGRRCHQPRSQGDDAVERS